ncbi:nSTAND3 domain-containing NTPase [Shewanella surugensis]|uniref:Restriction endonuclease n=1 Tax=Shewanella surugensis TaxID=212020 RepID=A0ABT0LHX5_9GAMM|nr:restriction endonuclease [Shewanella surugensis]MCL1126726.1 restriction endonuclease [Shewanella surugensis]
MKDYDFSSLNDKEFELLSTDLLSCHLGCHVERFKTGRDAGVDGRFFSSDDNEVVIQCKHWLKSGLTALLRSITNTEIEKVRKLNPTRYIFVTSLTLSRVNKMKIKKLFSPFVKIESDVFGNEDLNDILAKNPLLEKKHYKLWMTSSNVLEAILNSAIIGRSKHKLQEIIDDSNHYVMTQNHTQAMEKLEKVHSIIITGAPGVGKTSLADQLCKFYTANNYEFCFIENSLNEAEEFYKENAKQIFYFDDFLGRNFILALGSHQDSHIISFIKRVERDSEKRFILTSRTNILNQGKRLSELFYINKVDKNEYELSITSLSSFDKAKILYNHIWFGKLDESYINEIYKEKRYLEIIKHNNFNPRIISFITDSHRLLSVPPENYWDHIENILSNPKDIWRHVFDVQIDELSRSITIAISLHGKAISEDTLKTLYYRLNSRKGIVNADKSYDAVVRLLVGALLNRLIISSDKVLYNLFNPSIADFVITNYLDDFNYIDELLFCLRTPQSIKNLQSLVGSKVISKKFYYKILESQIMRFSLESDEVRIDPYQLIILASFDNVSSLSDRTVNYIFRLADYCLDKEYFCLGSDYFEFFNLVFKSDLINCDDPRLLLQLEWWITSHKSSFDEFISLSKIISLVENFTYMFTSEFKKQYIEFFSKNITNDIIEEGIQLNIYGCDDFNDIDIDIEILSYIENKVLDLDIFFEKTELEEISYCCDIDAVIQSNIGSIESEELEHEVNRDMSNHITYHSDDIHDLFDRG